MRSRVEHLGCAVILTESERLREEVLRLLRVEYGMDQLRTGTHVSSLIYCLSKEWYAVHDPLPVTDEEVALFAIGYGLERVLISRDRAEPFEVDGITLSPDMTLLGLAGDVKSTRMAPNTSAGCAICGEPYRGHGGLCECGHAKADHVSGIGCMAGVDDNTARCGCAKFYRHAYEKAPPVAFELPMGWQRQFMAYVYGLAHACTCPQWWLETDERVHQTVGYDRMQHHSLCALSGPLARGGGGNKGVASTAFGVAVVHLISAEIKAYEARWTEAELKANWQWLLERKATRERLLASDNPEPYQHRLYEDECRTCRYGLMCGLRASIDQLKEKTAVE